MTQVTDRRSVLPQVIAGVALGDRPGSFDISLSCGEIAAIEVASTDDKPSWLALPAFVNMHAHADRSFVSPFTRPASLEDAVRAAKLQRASSSSQDIAARARLLLDRAASHGTLGIRTHTDVDPAIGMRAIEGVRVAAAEVAGFMDVEIVAFANAANDPLRPGCLDLMRTAVARGATLLGGVPAMYDKPWESTEALLDLATELNIGVDLHLDEHLDGASSLLDSLAHAVVERGLQGRITASHACAVSNLNIDQMRRVLENVARAEVTLVVLPELNLYLQQRGEPVPRQRGLAPVLEAVRAGVAVRLGTDNVRDWFFPFGDADLLESGYVAALAAHLDAPADLLAALCDGRRGLTVGEPADLVLIRAGSLDDALARRPSDRVLLRKGQRSGPCDFGTVDCLPLKGL